MIPFDARLKGEALVLSDVHAGDGRVDIRKVVDFIRFNPVAILFLAGDLLELFVCELRRNKGRDSPFRTPDALAVLDALLEVLAEGRKVVIIPGNHDMLWMWLKRKYNFDRLEDYPQKVRARMNALVSHSNCEVVDEYRVGGTLIVHGHRGLQGDMLWRAGEIITRMRGHMRSAMPGQGKTRLVVWGELFYFRMALWARLRGVRRVIHGHLHFGDTVKLWGVTMDCLPTWRAGEGEGGGMLLTSEGEWVRVVGY